MTAHQIDAIVTEAVRVKYPKMAQHALVALAVLGEKFAPRAFYMGGQYNQPGNSQISLALLQYAVEEGLTTEQAIAQFAEAYQEVLDDPEGDSHPNIRQLQVVGLGGFHISYGFQARFLPAQIHWLP